MKLKSKKIISVLSSIAVTAAFAGGIYTDMPFNDNSAKCIVCAEEPTEWEADIYYVIVDETDEYTKHYQWYTTDNKGFSFNGARIKLNGNDITDDCLFQVEKDVTPDQVYDGKNFDYEVPFNFISSNNDTISAKLPVKIGQRGDVNMDHIVDVRDTSEIIRDKLFFDSNKSSKLDEFGLFLGAPEKETYAYGLSVTEAATLANKLAKAALDRANGTKYENKGESEYSVSISKANGLPGETVTVQVVVEADDSFESLDALIEWDDDTLKSAGAVSVNGTLCESYVEDGMVSIVDYSSGGVKDGAIASIEFMIPEDAQPGTSLDVYFSSVETFAIYKDGATIDQSNVVNVAGATIGVIKPASSEPVVTDTPETSTTTTTTTTTTKASTTTTKATTTATTNVSTTASTTKASISTTTPVASTSKIISTSVTLTQIISIPTTTNLVTTAPPVSSTTGTITVIPVQQGDANLDGKVDVRDAAYIAYRLALGEGTMLHNIADYNYDSKIDVRDAAAIAKYLATKYN